MNEQGKKALIRVAEWLEAGAPHVVIKEGQAIAEFNMNYGGEYIEDACGTACCIAGALVQFEGLMQPDDDGAIEFFSEDAEDVDEDDERQLGAGEVAQNFLGITETQADKLFMPFQHFEYEISQEFSRPARAAAVVRHFLETDEVSWDLFDEDGFKVA
jgi:hypothetical protein